MIKKLFTRNRKVGHRQYYKIYNALTPARSYIYGVNQILVKK